MSSGVWTWGWSCPGMGRPVERPRPSRRHVAPVATTTSRAPAARTSPAVMGEAGNTSTVPSPAISPRRQSTTRRHAASPGRRASRATRPPTSGRASSSWTWCPRWPRARAASNPAGPAPITMTGAGLRRTGMRSGCQPRRHSSPMVGFWVHRIGSPLGSVDTQMLQPMHSRIDAGPAVADLRRQERVGDRGPRGPDQVEHAAAYRGDHRIRAGVAPDPDDWLGRQALDERDVGLLVALRCEPGGGRVVAPVRHVDVPQVGELGEHAHDLGRLPIVGDPVGAGQLVDGQAHRHRAVVTDGVQGVLDQLAQEPHAVGQAPAVLVGPVVVPA